MKKVIVLIILFILIGGCTVIKNYGTLHYVPNRDTRLIDWHPNKHPGYSVFDRNTKDVQVVDSVSVDTTGIK
ncbi:MAG: hypothetical protein KAH32_05515 [Chlamydiia bacterium]|nr:hypothetical protein [Chlamydiia bacterium]